MNPEKLMHRGVVFALTLTLLGLAGCAGGDQTGADARIIALQDQVSRLQKQAQAATDYVDIANLQAIYGYYVDKSRWDDAAALFAPDATLEIAGRGIFKGQQRISEYLHQLGDMTYGRLYNHMQLQPVIHVAEDGLTAKARWRAFMQVGKLNQEARWGEGTYENEYAKIDGTWRISKLHSYITFYVDFDKGWNKGGVPLPKHLDRLEPDGDTTVKYGAFPDVFLPPYHYPNPVTKK